MRKGSQLFLSSGTSFFDASFQSLPHVVDALAQPPDEYARTLDRLHHDLNASEQALDRLVDLYGDALLASVSSLNTTSIEFQTSQARIRHVRDFVTQAHASLTSRRRDLLNLAFREAQLVKMAEVAKKLHGVAVHTEAGHVHQAQRELDALPKDLAPDVVAHLQARLDARTAALIAQAKTALARFASGEDDRAVPEGAIEVLRQHRELDGFVASLIHFELHPPSSLPNDAAPLRLRPRFLALASSPDALLPVVDALIAWAESLLKRRAQLAAVTACDCGLPTLWEAVQGAIEAALGPRLLPAAASPPRMSQSLLANSLAKLRDSADKAAYSTAAAAPSSPYLLPAITRKLLECARRNGALAGTRDGSLEAFVYRSVETLLLPTVERDAQWALAAASAQQPHSTSSYVRLANRALAVVAEIRSLVLQGLDKSLARPVLGVALRGFIETTSAHLGAQSDGRPHPRDPLWLLLTSMNKTPSKPMPARRALVAACCEFARLGALLHNVQGFPRVDLLVAIHACALRLERACAGDAVADTFTLISERAIVAARAALESGVAASRFTKDADEARRVVELLEAQYEACEGWADSRAVIDFCFMPLVAKMARALALEVIAASSSSSLLGGSAAGDDARVGIARLVRAGLSRILGDKPSDFAWFDGVLLLARAAALRNERAALRHFIEAPKDEDERASKRELQRIWIARALATGVVESDEASAIVLA